MSVIWKNSRVYWLAFVVYWGILLFGYDTGIAGGVVVQPSFQRSFGLIHANGEKNVDRTNEVSSNVVSVLQAGAFFGALGSAPLSAAFGRRRTLLLSALVFVVGAILTTIADGGPTGLAEIYAGRVISGVGIGAISAVAPTYVSECSPKDVRGQITGLFQVMVATGVMLSYFINYGIGLHVLNGPNVWRIPFGFQLVPAGMMVLGLLTIRESPRWLASVDRNKEARANLAYFRKDPEDSEAVSLELAEIEAAILEERDSRRGLGLREAFFGKGNLVRFVIAFTIFALQQWSGQNSVGYYAPQIFTSLGYRGTTSSLLASGVYGILKVLASCAFLLFLVETVGRKRLLFISAIGMGALFFIIGAILKTHPPPAVRAGSSISPPPASRAMAAMLYIYVCFYSVGWGPLPWVYVSDIFPTRTRHYGLSLGSATQWLFNFVVAKLTPMLVTNLGYSIFFLFGTINLAGMAVFALLLPETSGRSLEEMDILFGSVRADQRATDVEIQKQRQVGHGKDLSESTML